MSEIRQFQFDRIYSVPGSIKPYELVRRDGIHLTFEVMDTNPGIPRIVEADSFIVGEHETVRFEDGIVLSTRFVPDISIDNLELFKGFIKEGFCLAPLTVTYGFLELEVHVETTVCYGEDDRFAVKVASLYAYYKASEDYRLVKVWTNAYSKEDLLETFPEIVDTVDPALLTYDFEELSSVIDQMLSPEGREERWPGSPDENLPF